LPSIDHEIIAKCEKCGFGLERPFPSFELADDPRCPQCHHDMMHVDNPRPLDDLSSSRLLMPGWKMNQARREYVGALVEKAFAQGLTGIDIRVTFTDRFDDECIVEVLATD